MKKDLTVLEAYQEHVTQRAAEGIAPKALTAEQVQALTELLVTPPADNTVDCLATLQTDKVCAAGAEQRRVYCEGEDWG